MRHRSLHFVMDSRGHNKPLLQILLLIRVQTMLNHCRFVCLFFFFYYNIDVKLNNVFRAWPLLNTLTRVAFSQSYRLREIGQSDCIITADCGKKKKFMSRSSMMNLFVSDKPFCKVLSDNFIKEVQSKSVLLHLLSSIRRDFWDALVAHVTCNKHDFYPTNIERYFLFPIPLF